MPGPRQLSRWVWCHFQQPSERLHSACPRAAAAVEKESDTMDLVLRKLFAGRRELRQAEPEFLRGVPAGVSKLALGELSRNSVDSLRSAKSARDTNGIRLQKTRSRQSGSQSHRDRSQRNVLGQSSVDLGMPSLRSLGTLGTGMSRSSLTVGVRLLSSMAAAAVCLCLQCEARVL